MEENEGISTIEEKHQQKNTLGSKIVPIFLVVLGTYFLLREYNLLDNALVQNVIRLWPLIFIYIGLDRLTVDKSRLRPIIIIILVSLAVFFVLLQSDGNIPFMK